MFILCQHHIKSQAKMKKLLGVEKENLDLLPKIYLPSTYQRFIWEFTGLCICLYFFLTLPLRASFLWSRFERASHISHQGYLEFNHNVLPWLILDVLFDIFLTVDSFLRSRRFCFQTEDRRIISNQVEIFKKSLGDFSFHFDCLICGLFPISYIIGGTVGWQWFNIAQFFHFILIYRYRQFRDFISRLTNFTKAKVSVEIIRLVLFVAILVIAMHIGGCLWFAVGLFEINRGLYSWIEADNSLNTTLQHQYIRALYFPVAIAAKTNGYYDILPRTVLETLFSIAYMLILGISYFVSVGLISSMINKVVSQQRRFEEKIDLLYFFVRKHELPKRIKKQSSAYFEYLFMRARGAQEKNILNEFPSSLKDEIGASLNFEAVSSLSLFSRCSPSLLKLVLSKMNYVLFLPGEYIVKANLIAKEMFVINRGKAIILGDEKKEKTTHGFLTSGSCYSEALFLLQLP
jgi:cyclic nucleotide gated channel beta 1